MRERTTRCRRLRDRQRSLIQETIIENVMLLVSAEKSGSRKSSSDILCKKMLTIVTSACSNGIDLPKNLVQINSQAKSLMKRKARK